LPINPKEHPMSDTQLVLFPDSDVTGTGRPSPWPVAEPVTARPEPTPAATELPFDEEPQP
jgi:hypothetical protein